MRVTKNVRISEFKSVTLIMNGLENDFLVFFI